jgi:hypothetical protein
LLEGRRQVEEQETQLAIVHQRVPILDLHGGYAGRQRNGAELRRRGRSGLWRARFERLCPEIRRRS